MQSKKYIKETINLKTLTPVFIGGDQANNLSPITDYVVKNGKVFIIDQRKFENLLSKDTDLIDEYVTLVKQGKFDLESFIENKLNSSVQELSKKEISVEGYIERGEIQTFISSNGNTFIPGTTIKGSIRTSIIYNWLTSTSFGKSKVDKLLDLYNKIENADEIISKKGKKFLDRDDKKWLRENDKSKKLSENTYKELKLFDVAGQGFRHLQISDSNFINDADTKIIQINREYLTKNQIKTSPWLHVLKENSETNFDIKLVTDFKDDFLKQLNNRDIKDLFKMINQFSVDFIEFEIERFEEYIKNAKTDRKETLQGTIAFYNELNEKIKFARNSIAVLRTGGGKTYFDNSIGLALYKKDKDKFKQFRKLLGFWKHRSGSGGFVEEDSPITRSFYFDSNLKQNRPLGWVLLYLDKDKEDVNKLFGSSNEKEEIGENAKETKVEVDDSEDVDFSKLANTFRVTKKRK